MKKAQIEIVGLVFIVLIITVGFLFYVSYSLTGSNKTDDYYSDYKNVATSNNFINSLMIMDVQGHMFRDLIKDCATSKRFYFDVGDSCAKINETINIVANETLKEWGLRYGLLIQFTKGDEYPNRILAQSDSDCAPRQFLFNVTTSSPGYFPISLYPYSNSPAFIELVFCS